ncbi:MAG: hypothetical protein J5666_01365, partial [Bacilli bacterium]|nr:hypothetical protein [Bacilli bacterium]
MEKIYKVKELWAISRQNHRKNGFIPYIVFFFASLLMAGFLALGLISPFILIPVIPLFVIPLFFAAEVSAISLRDMTYFTFKNFFKAFGIYFTNQFSSTYRVLKSFLFSLIFYGGTLLTSTFVSVVAFYFTNYCGFQELIHSISILDIINSEELLTLMNKFEYCINMLLICTNLPAVAMFYFTFMYLIEKNSISMFHRMENISASGKLMSDIQTLVYKNNKKLYLKYYLGLSWPLFILIVGGFAVGAYLATFYQLNATTMWVIGIGTSLIVSLTLYGNMHLTNKETIYLAFKEEY